jgi:hypothetical protein
MQLLIEEHNAIIRKFYSKTFPEVKSEDIPFVSCHEIVHTSMLVSVDAQDLQLVSIYNSFYALSLIKRPKSVWLTLASLSTLAMC